ncbi:MAG: low-specificity L-threonine aldolase [Gammaproteobacteria bacterium]|nr:low-specificity L-threonine aldolase [Gammaproteobacteria bacterium]
MLTAMMAAETGDDVYGEDPTVNELESYAAELTGHEAALFVSTGTQGNLLALLSQCDRGHEYIAGQEAHSYKFEGGGAAVLGGIQPQPLPFNPRGELVQDQVNQAIKPDDFHFARTKLVCLENTQGGKVLSSDYLNQFGAFVRSKDLRFHLDGARVFNAAVRQNVPVKEITGLFDSVSLCLSKGLGCPAGSLLVSDAVTIQKARRYRKMLGGGMRQVGIIAASGIFALQHHIDRLEIDHRNASNLGDALSQLEHISLAEPVQTNMVMLDLSGVDVKRLQAFLLKREIQISGPRLVTHLDISAEDIEVIIGAFRQFEEAG